MYIPPKEAKVFVTKTKAPYLIAIELYDPLEIINEPLIIEPIPSFRNKAPPNPEKATKKQKTMTAYQSVLVLGSMPRNLVDPEPAATTKNRRRRRIKMEEEDIITIANFEKKKKPTMITKHTSLIFNLEEDMCAMNCVTEVAEHENVELMDGKEIKAIRRSSMSGELENIEETKKSTITENSISKEEEMKFPKTCENFKNSEFSLSPMLVQQNDIVKNIQIIK